MGSVHHRGISRFKLFDDPFCGFLARDLDFLAEVELRREGGQEIYGWPSLSIGFTHVGSSVPL